MKSLALKTPDSMMVVAPLAGAWIEICTAADFRDGLDVAPLAGAWIEISAKVITKITVSMSHPSRVRGLKSRCDGVSDCRRNVAPLAGAWIEMAVLGFPRHALGVAPLAGAWIEICRAAPPYSGFLGRTPRGCVD